MGDELKEYADDEGRTFLLSKEDAETRGLKSAPAPKNKAATPKNKSATPPTTK